MTFKKLLFVCLFSIFNIFITNAQNKEEIAYNNTTISFEKLNIADKIIDYDNPSSDIYDNWNNKDLHSKTDSIPKTYNINLKDFSMPIERGYITSEYGYRATFKRNHYGIDIKAYVGDTIRAAFSGKVRVVQTHSGYGKLVIIRHYNGMETIYAHLSKQIVKPNEIVKSGQPIGLAGNTGRSTGTHLHFETRFCGVPINPLEIFSFKDKDVLSDFYSWKKK